MRRLAILVSMMLYTSFALSLDNSVRIVGGNQIPISDAPWQAYLKIGSTFCGGVVIAPTWVLTAAHCLDGASSENEFSLMSANQISVYTGTNNINGANFSQYRSTVSAVYVHQDYNKPTFANDIAIIQLAENVHQDAQVIQLIAPDQLSAFEAGENQNLEDIMLSGWGYTQANRQNLPSFLQSVQVSLVASRTCALTWGSTMTSVPDYAEKYLCTFRSNASACNGDSGGPVVWHDSSLAGDADQGARLVGLVSFGIEGECASSRFPDVNTRISNYFTWIEDCQQGECYALSSNAVFSIPDDSSSGGGSVFFYIFAGVCYLWRMRFHLSCCRFV